MPWPFGEWSANGIPGGKKDKIEEIAKTIDQQYWQRVNTIRVAGAGVTSYAIAKDDIGNWYVKSYTGDPTPIIEGAKNVVLYAGAPALAGAKIGANNLPGSTVTNVAPQPDLLDREYKQFAANYNAATLADGTNVYGFLTNLETRIEGKTNSLGATNVVFWNSVTNNYNSYLSTSELSFSNALASGEATNIDKQILATFHQLQRFQTSFFADSTATPDEKNIITNVVSLDLNDMINTRLNNLGKYQNALTVLGQFQQ